MLDVHDNPICFTFDGGIEPICEFPYDIIDTHGQHQDAPEALAADALKKILLWIWTSPEDFPATFNKLAVLSVAIDPNLVRVKNNAELAEVLGVTKANVSKILCEACREFGVHLRQRTDSGIERMRRARLAQRDSSGHVKGHGGKRPEDKRLKRT